MVMKIKTPGVYIDEVNAFPNSVVPVATAVPAFIGYTPVAEYEGKSYYNKAVRITSFAEFQAFFMLDNPPPPADPAKQYNPEYYLVEQKEEPDTGDYMSLNGSLYSILPDPNTIYYLYNSIRLFYQNGGGDAYIVAVGGYGPSAGKPLDKPGDPLVNPNVKLTELQNGLAVLKKETEPTMYICPEATVLSVKDNATLMQSMLLQAQEMQTTICIFDIIGGKDPDPVLYTQDIETFRNNTGTSGLDRGAAYYPFIGTTIMQNSDIDFTNLFGGDTKKLDALINPPSAPNTAAQKILNMIQSPPNNPMTDAQLQASLLVASKTYSEIVNRVLSSANMLPPSGALAGVYTVNDNTRGVWLAPANTGIVGAVSLPINLSEAQQADLNVDAVSGKSVNAIRFFKGQGILIWGARTLAGNSQDWRYISVRRTLDFLEQSIKLAARAYVFSANDVNTWGAVKSMISGFLTDVWKEGGLQGAAAADAFQVEIGLGSTMTAEDILNGLMRVSVKVAVVHPAEFIVITFEQEMAKS